MRKALKRVGISFLAVILVGPFLIPVKTSGTLTKEEAAKTIWNDKSKWIELANHEVHYVIAGDPNSDRVIILLHGFGASAFSYSQVLEPLSELGFVVAYDRAAFGFTERPTQWEINPYGTPGQVRVLDELINKFGKDKKVYVVGHSAGGSIAASYALEHQNKLAGLVLFAPAVLTSGGAPSWLNWIFSIPQINHVGPRLVSTIATNGLSILYSSYFDESKVTQETLNGYTAPLKIAGWEKAFWEFNKAPRDTKVGDRINEISVPTLVIAGDSDKIVKTQDSIRVSELISGSELVIIPQTGHLPNEEAPSEFAEAVKKFISKN
jgi:pimeloyl-ACP methyl ester carboxylesterase